MVEINHNDHIIKFTHVGGSMPQMRRVVDFVLSDSDVREEIDWAVESYHRKYPISISEYVGMSGRCEQKLFVSRTEHVNTLHGEDWKFDAKLVVTCYGKISIESTLFSGGIFSGDLADLLHAGGWTEMSKHHRWRYVKPRSPLTPTATICGRGYTGGEPVVDRPARGHRDAYTPITE